MTRWAIALLLMCPACVFAQSAAPTTQPAATQPSSALEPIRQLIKQIDPQITSRFGWQKVELTKDGWVDFTNAWAILHEPTWQHTLLVSADHLKLQMELGVGGLKLVGLNVEHPIWNQNLSPSPVPASAPSAAPTTIFTATQFADLAPPALRHLREFDVSDAVAILPGDKSDDQATVVYISWTAKRDTSSKWVGGSIVRVLHGFFIKEHGEIEFSPTGIKVHVKDISVNWPPVGMLPLGAQDFSLTGSLATPKMVFSGGGYIEVNVLPDSPSTATSPPTAPPAKP